MAAIDKMYLKTYGAFAEFRTWCVTFKPSLLDNFYDWLMPEDDWDKWKEHVFKTRKEVLTREHESWSSVEACREHYRKYGCKVPLDQLEQEVADHLEEWEKIHAEKEYIQNIELPVTNFSTKQDKYLLWHCPIPEVREYLHKQCGYREKWYYKFFFKKL